MATPQTESPTPDTGAYRSRVDTDDEDELALALVDALATQRNEQPTELSLDVHEYVDTDALEQLARHTERTDATWTLTFDVEEWTVTVSSDGWLEVA